MTDFVCRSHTINFESAKSPPTPLHHAHILTLVFTLRLFAARFALHLQHHITFASSTPIRSVSATITSRSHSHPGPQLLWRVLTMTADGVTQLIKLPFCSSVLSKARRPPYPLPWHYAPTLILRPRFLHLHFHGSRHDRPAGCQIYQMTVLLICLVNCSITLPTLKLRDANDDCMTPTTVMSTSEEAAGGYNIEEAHRKQIHHIHHH